jgi:hypothetical protein
VIRLQIVLGRGSHELTLTLLDTKLLTSDGDVPVEQDFETVGALVQHVQRVVALRQRGGYRVLAERKDDSVIMPPDPKASRAGEEWDQPTRKLTERIAADAEAAVECGAILDRAGALRARALRVIAAGKGPGAALSRALRERPLPAVTCFAFVDPSLGAADQRAACGRLDEILLGLPNAERVQICGPFATQAIRHSSLRVLSLVGPAPSIAALDALAASALPALEELEILSREGAVEYDQKAFASAAPRLATFTRRTASADAPDDLFAIW